MPIEKIKNWLGKPVVITCDEVTTAQLPHVFECMCHAYGVELVVFNNRVDDMQADSLHSVQSSYPSYVGSSAMTGASGTTILNKIPSTTLFRY